MTAANAKIPCTLGMLAYNRAQELPRALASVKDFAEVIVADGGSTDGSQVLAESLGARVVAQSNPGHPIEDFALERNRLLAEAKQPWFFYLDSDELMTPELAAAIRAIASDPANAVGAYRVRYLKTNADASRVYRTFKEYYQIRLVRTGIGARFVRPVHERLELAPGTLVGQLEASWLVTFDAEYFKLSVFAKKAWRRTGMQARAWQPAGAWNIVRRILLEPLLATLKSLVKMLVVKVRYGRAAIPAHYEWLRILYAWMLALQYAARLFEYP